MTFTRPQKSPCPLCQGLSVPSRRRGLPGVLSVPSTAGYPFSKGIRSASGLFSVPSFRGYHSPKGAGSVKGLVPCPP